MAPDLTSPGAAGNWSVARRFYLDLQYGPELEHLRRQLYTMTVTPYGGMYFAFVTVLEWPKEFSNAVDADVERIYLATSRDGLNYDLTWIYAEQPLFSPGTYGSFDNGTMFPSSQFVSYKDEHYIFYKGCPHGHENRPPKGEANCQIGVVRFDLDSLAYLVPKDTEEWSTVTTKQFKLEGDELEVNVGMLSSSGELVVEILNPETHEPFPGFGCGDGQVLKKTGIHERVGWKNMADMKQLHGKMVMFQFHFVSASLRAFQVL